MSTPMQRETRRLLQEQYETARQQDIEASGLIANRNSSATTHDATAGGLHGDNTFDDEGEYRRAWKPLEREPKRLLPCGHSSYFLTPGHLGPGAMCGECERIARLEAENAALKAQVPFWVPVNEAWPALDSRVLLLRRDGMVVIGWRKIGCAHWILECPSNGRERITHWTPLPDADALLERAGGEGGEKL